MRKFYFKPQYEKRMYELMRTFLWSLFNELAMDKEFKVTIRPGVKSQIFKCPKEEFRIDKKTYKVCKPDIEHIENDNLDTAELTSDDDSEAELMKEQNFCKLQEKTDPYSVYKTLGGYGDTKTDQYGEFEKHKVTKEDKKQR